MSTRTIYRRRGIHIDIGKAKDNLDKDGRPKCFNCNTYRYMAKKCQRLKKEKKQESTISTIKQDILQRTVGQDRR